MTKDSKIKRISNEEIYNKLDSLEEKISEEKTKNKSYFMISLMMFMGLAIFIVGITFFINLMTELGADLWIISIGYMGIGIFLLFIGLSAYSRIFEKK